MTCPTANRLRQALYSVSTQYTEVTYPLPENVLVEILAERERPEYQAALAALREHIRECEICRSKRTE